MNGGLEGSLIGIVKKKSGSITVENVDRIGIVVKCHKSVIYKVLWFYNDSYSGYFTEEILMDRIKDKHNCWILLCRGDDEKGLLATKLKFADKLNIG
jgi:hypothetical protein